MPPNPDDWDGPHAEIRIESFFADLSQLFVEGHFEWREPAWLTNLNVRDMLHTVEAYLDAEVRVFVSSVAA